MILKRKVSDLNNDRVPTQTATTASSHSQKVGNEENEEDDPEEKGKLDNDIVLTKNCYYRQQPQSGGGRYPWEETR